MQFGAPAIGRPVAAHVAPRIARQPDQTVQEPAANQPDEELSPKKKQRAESQVNLC